MASWTAFCQLLGLDEEALRCRVQRASDFAFSSVCHFYSAVAPGLFASSSQRLPPPSAISDAVRSPTTSPFSEAFDAGSEVPLSGWDVQRSAPPMVVQHALSGQSTGALEEGDSQDALEGVVRLFEEERTPVGGEERVEAETVEVHIDREGGEVVIECEEGVTSCQWEGGLCSRDSASQTGEEEEGATSADMATQWEGDFCVDAGAESEPEIAVGDVAGDRQAEASEGDSSKSEIAGDIQESLEEACAQESDLVAHLKTQLFCASSLADELIERLERSAGPLRGLDALIVAHVRRQQRLWADSARLKPRPVSHQPAPSLPIDDSPCCFSDASLGSSDSPDRAMDASCDSSDRAMDASFHSSDSPTDASCDSSDSPTDASCDSPDSPTDPSGDISDSPTDGSGDILDSPTDGSGDSADNPTDASGDSPDSATDASFASSDTLYSPVESISGSLPKSPPDSPPVSPRSPLDFSADFWLVPPTKEVDEEQTKVAGSEDACAWDDVDESLLGGVQSKEPALPVLTVKKDLRCQESFQPQKRQTINGPRRRTFGAKGAGGRRGMGHGNYAQKPSEYSSLKPGVVRNQRSNGFSESQKRTYNERRGGSFSGGAQVKDQSIGKRGQETPQARNNGCLPSAAAKEARHQLESEKGQRPSLLRAEVHYAQVEEPIVYASHFTYEVLQMCGATAK